VVRADGVAGWRGRAPFDLVFANILLAPLQRFAAALTQCAAPGARVILSGILPTQANAIIAAYHRLTLQRRIDVDGWTTLVFLRPSPLPLAGEGLGVGVEGSGTGEDGCTCTRLR
jgi:ribosomal protein L11 methylase PrmA